MKKYSTSNSSQPACQHQPSEQQKQSYFNSFLQKFIQAHTTSQDPPLPQQSSLGPAITGSSSLGNSTTINSSLGPASNLHNPNQCNSHLCSTGMISSLFQIVQSQAQALECLNKKVEGIVANNKELINKVRALETQNTSLRSSAGRREEQEISWKDSLPQVKIQGESVNKESLLDILFGKQKYEYQLQIVEELDLPLYRERNFNINIELVKNKTRIINSNKIPMSLALYTCENPPKFIEKNTAGQKMLKGYVDQALINGVCHFEKVQIREVTSHYRSGWIFLVAIPCMTPLGANKTENFVDFTQIKPLVIDEVVVKAKKPKKKDGPKQESDEGVEYHK